MSVVYARRSGLTAFTVLIILSLTAVLAGCSEYSDVPPLGSETGNEIPSHYLEQPPSLVGVITDIQDGDPRSIGEDADGDADQPALDPDTPVSDSDDTSPVRPHRQIQVEENPEEMSGSGKAVLYFDADTIILRQEADDYAAIRFDDLAVGDRVQVWYHPDAPIMDSYPLQTTAGMVMLISEQE